MHISTINNLNYNTGFKSSIKIDSVVNRKFMYYIDSFNLGKSRLCESECNNFRAIVAGFDSLLNDGKNDYYEILSDLHTELGCRDGQIVMVNRPKTKVLKNNERICESIGIASFTNLLRKFLPKVNLKILTDYEAESLELTKNAELSDCGLNSRDLFEINVKHLKKLKENFG